MKLFVLLGLICSFLHSFGQEFEGEIVYKVNYPELMLNSIPPEFRDSVQITKKMIKIDQIRTETHSGMGKQILLEKIGSDTSYLLLNLMGKNLALVLVDPDPSEKKKDSLTIEGKADKLHGYKCKQATYHKNGVEHLIIFTTELSADYGNSFKSLGGLALVFPIVLSEQDVLFYTCIAITEKEVSSSEFEIPSNFVLTSMEEFAKLIGG